MSTLRYATPSPAGTKASRTPRSPGERTQKLNTAVDADRGALGAYRRDFADERRQARFQHVERGEERQQRGYQTPEPGQHRQQHLRRQQQSHRYDQHWLQPRFAFGVYDGGY